MFHYKNIYLTRNLKSNVTYLTFFIPTSSSWVLFSRSSMTCCQTVLPLPKQFPPLPMQICDFCMVPLKIPMWGLFVKDVTRSFSNLILLSSHNSMKCLNQPTPKFKHDIIYEMSPTENEKYIHEHKLRNLNTPTVQKRNVAAAGAVRCWQLRVHLLLLFLYQSFSWAIIYHKTHII